MQCRMKRGWCGSLCMRTENDEHEGEAVGQKMALEGVWEIVGENGTRMAEK